MSQNNSTALDLALVTVRRRKKALIAGSGAIFLLSLLLALAFRSHPLLAGSPRYATEAKFSMEFVDPRLPALFPGGVYDSLMEKGSEAAFLSRFYDFALANSGRDISIENREQWALSLREQQRFSLIFLPGAPQLRVTVTDEDPRYPGLFIDEFIPELTALLRDQLRDQFAFSMERYQNTNEEYRRTSSGILGQPVRQIEAGALRTEPTGGRFMSYIRAVYSLNALQELADGPLVNFAVYEVEERTINPPPVSLVELMFVVFLVLELFFLLSLMVIEGRRASLA